MHRQIWEALEFRDAGWMDGWVEGQMDSWMDNQVEIEQESTKKKGRNVFNKK